MWIDLKRLRKAGVEFDWDKRNDSISFQIDTQWSKEQIDAFRNFTSGIGLQGRDEDELNMFVDTLLVMRALRTAAS